MQTIPLDGLFKDYMAGGSLAEITDIIVGAYRESRLREDSFLESLHDYSSAESTICYRLVNMDKVRRWPVPYMPFLDLAAIFYVPFMEDDNWFSTVTVTESLMHRWGISDTGILYASAHRNTCGLFPAKMVPMAKLLNSLLPEQDEAYTAGALPMFVVTNSTGLHGASVILYDGLLKASANVFRDDLFILPSSIHETLFLPASACSCTDSLKEMVMSVNKSDLDEDDVLSNSVYYYDRKTDRIKIT